jgi:hypothetical protein
MTKVLDTNINAFPVKIAINHGVARQTTAKVDVLLGMATVAIPHLALLWHLLLVLLPLIARVALINRYY